MPEVVAVDPEILQEPLAVIVQEPLDHWFAYVEFPSVSVKLTGEVIQLPRTPKAVTELHLIAVIAYVPTRDADAVEPDVGKTELAGVLPQEHKIIGKKQTKWNFPNRKEIISMMLRQLVGKSIGIKSMFAARSGLSFGRAEYLEMKCGCSPTLCRESTT